MSRPELFIVLGLGLLLLVASALAAGLLNHLDGRDALLGLGLIFVVRPLSGWIGLIGSRASPAARVVISFFGVRGVGTLFYLLYALRRNMPQPDRLSALIGFVVLVSILTHGISATPAMAAIGRLRERREAAA